MSYFDTIFTKFVPKRPIDKNGSGNSLASNEWRHQLTIILKNKTPLHLDLSFLHWHGFALSTQFVWKLALVSLRSGSCRIIRSRSSTPSRKRCLSSWGWCRCYWESCLVSSTMCKTCNLPPQTASSVPSTKDTRTPRAFGTRVTGRGWWCKWLCSKPHTCYIE